MKGLKNVRVYLRNVGIVTTNIGIENGRVAYIGDDGENIESLFETDGVVLPGFIDEHIHGAGGADAMDALRHCRPFPNISQERELRAFWLRQ